MKEVRIGKYGIVTPKKRAFQIDTPPDEIRLPGNILMVGARGSGKTLAAVSKLVHLKRQGLCHRVFVISPTLWSNKPVLDLLGDSLKPEDTYEHPSRKAVEDILQKMEVEAQGYEQYKALVKKHKTLQRLLSKKVSIDAIDPSFLLESHEAGLLDGPPQPPHGTEHPCFHLLVDDCQSSNLFSLSPKNPFLNLVIRHRHVGRGLGLTIFLCVQNYSAAGGGVPRSIRDNATVLCLFKLKSKTVLKQIVEEVANDVEEAAFLQAYDYATAEPHSFLTVDFFPRTPQQRFRKGWDAYLLLDQRGASPEK